MARYKDGTEARLGDDVKGPVRVAGGREVRRVVGRVGSLSGEACGVVFVETETFEAEEGAQGRSKLSGGFAKVGELERVE